MDESRPAPAGPPQPQRLGEFKIVRQIARGGMGEIYEAVHERLLRRVAVKTIRRDRPSDEARLRFQREQLVLARLHQTHVIPIYTAGEENAWQYFVMPYIDGLTLQRALRAAWQHAAARPQARRPALEELVDLALRGEIGLAGEGEQPAPSAAYFRSVARVMAQAAEAMQHVHDLGFVHRDLKPSNIMLEPADPVPDRGGHCWVIDFGLAGYLRASTGALAVSAADPACRPATGGEEDATESAILTGSQALGTLRYMAPEQLHGKADARSDVWGLGMTLCELLVLRPVGRDRPDAAHPPAVHWPDGVPPDLRAICDKALQPDPAQRYPTARAFAEDLRRWLENRPTAARPARLLRGSWLLCRRHPGWAAAAVTAAVALLLLVGLGAHVQRVRLEHAEKTAAVAAASDRDHLAEALHQEILRLSLGARGNGWSRQVEDRLRRLREIRADARLRDGWANSFLGLDARLVRRFQDGGAGAIAFDAAGGRLIVGGRDAEAGSSAAPPRLWDGKGEGLLLLSGRTGGGPVGFRPDGTPVQLLVEPRAPAPWCSGTWPADAPCGNKQVLLLVFLPCFAGGCGAPAGVDASQLYKEFSANKAEAQRKYQGEIVTFHGKIASNNNQGDAGRQVSLRVEGSDNPEAGILCSFRPTFGDAGKSSDLDRFKEGDTIVLKGRCRGIWQSGRTGKDSVVVFEDCELHK